MRVGDKRLTLHNYKCADRYGRGRLDLPANGELESSPYGSHAITASCKLYS